jgi:hypothetical protein
MGSDISAAAAAMARRKAAKMTAEERSEHGREMARKRWGKVRSKRKPKPAKTS